MDEFCLLSMMFLSNSQDEDTLYLGDYIENLSFNKRYGVGRGKNRISRNIPLHPILFYQHLKELKNSTQLYKLTRMTFCQFEEMKTNLNPEGKIVKMCNRITVEDKLLISLMWVHQYPSASIICTTFQTSEATVSRILKCSLPEIVSGIFNFSLLYFSFNSFIYFIQCYFSSTQINFPPGRILSAISPEPSVRWSNHAWAIW